MTVRLAVRLLAAMFVLLAGGCCSGVAAEPTRGLWLLPLKDAGNCSRADVSAQMATAPHEVWSFGGGSDAFAFCRAVIVGGKARYFGQVRSGLRLVEPDGETVWSHASMGVGAVLGVSDFLRTGGIQAVVTLGPTGVGLVDVADGKTLWTWRAPTGAYLGAVKLLWRPGDSRLVCFPQNTLTGLCFRFSAAKPEPELLWEQTYTNAYWQGYGPQIVLADMDNQGLPEVIIAGKPGYAGVADLDTGQMRFDLHYQVTDGPEIGRPYGLLTAEDLDGDGFRDIIVAACQVEEYVAVLRNVGGKALEHVWSQFIEKDYPEDHLELRPNIASVADINGDGIRELVLGLFNTGGDGKWRTVAFDPFGGYRARLLDLPGRYFWGCYDLTGDGRAEIITSAEPARRTAPFSAVQAVDGRTGAAIAAIPASRPVTQASVPLEVHTDFKAVRHTPIYVTERGHSGGLLLRRAAGTGPEELWRIAGDRSIFTPLKAASGGRALLLSRPQPDLAGVDLTFRGTGSNGGPDASSARVSLAGDRRELILALSDGRVIGGEPDWSQPGRFRRSWEMPGGLPSIWIGPDGQQVVCTVGPRLDEARIGRPAPVGHAPGRRVLLPYPVYGADVAKGRATVVPFGDGAMQLFVGLQTGVHTLACAMFDAGGRQLWLNEQTGPYPRTAAVARLEPDGPFALVVNDHYEKMIYSLDGSPRLGMPYGARDRNGSAYTTPYALPIVGPFGPAGETRIILGPGLDAVQALDANGTILAQKYFNTYEFEYCGSAPALLGPGTWGLGMANHAGIFHCFDIQTGQWRWTLDLGDETGLPINVSTVDLDGDGWDEYLVALPSGRLMALGEREGRGIALWSLEFSAGVRDAIAADLTGDGFAEVIVETDDGRVRVFASADGP